MVTTQASQCDSYVKSICREQNTFEVMLMRRSYRPTLLLSVEHPPKDLYDTSSVMEDIMILLLIKCVGPLKKFLNEI